MAMILGVNSALSIIAPNGVSFSPSSSSSSSSSLSFIKCGDLKPSSSSVVVTASSQSTVVVFEPFEEMKKKELLLLPSDPHTSIARFQYSNNCESAINQQINVECNVSYVYHAMYAYFDRDNVAPKGLASFFKESSAEEREHAEKFMEYQNKRGGKVMLQSTSMPVSEFDHAEKGDALHGEIHTENL